LLTSFQRSRRGVAGIEVLPDDSSVPGVSWVDPFDGCWFVIDERAGGQ